MLQKLSDREINSDIVIETETATDSDMSGDENFYLSAYEMLADDTKNLFGNVCIFVCDRYGNVVHGKDLGKMQNEFLCIMKCIHKDFRKKYLYDANTGTCEIYPSFANKGEYISVEHIENGVAKCAVISGSQDGCRELSEYAQKLEEAKRYLEVFAKRCLRGRENHGSITDFDSKIRGCNEIMKCSYPEEKSDYFNVDVEFLIKSVCEYAVQSGHKVSYERSGKRSKEQIFTNISALILKNIVYTTGFLINSNRENMLKIRMNISDKFLRLEMLAHMSGEQRTDLYFHSLVKNISASGIDGELSEKNQDMVFRASFPISDDKEITVGEKEDGMVYVTNIMNSPEVRDAYMLLTS